jgi:cyclic pyranopterin monophosphate synthase
MADSRGMVDIAGKEITVRTARAGGSICLGPDAFDALKQGLCPKGDVLATAKIAAIQAVKATSTIIPMCHPILVEGIDVGFSLDEARMSVGVTVVVKSSSKTGVEMEALHGVATACLTIYDMLKYAGKGMTIERIQLLEKTGGHSGDYKRNG